MEKKICMSVIVFIFLAVNVAGGYVYMKGGNGGGPGLSRTVVKYHDENEVKLAVSNNGPIGIDQFTGNGAGFWPANTPNQYVFGTGVWIGGLADVDGDGAQDTIFLQGYSSIDGGTEFREGRYDQDPNSELATIFKSTDSGDLDNWPEEFRILDEDPESETYGQMIPWVRSDQDMVCIYNTVNGTPKSGMNVPFQIEQRSMAFTNGLSRQVIFFIFDIENISDRAEGWDEFTLEDAWVGYASDMDIGTMFADDRTSVFTTMEDPESGDTIPINMGFAWDNDFDEGGSWVGQVGFVGIAYLQSPGNDFDGIDNDGDGLVDESPLDGIDDDGDGVVDDMPDEVDQLGLVNYTFFCGPSTCETRPDPQSDPEGFRMMKCDPPDECYETTEDTDVRFMIASGPFSMRPAEQHRIVLAFVFADPVGDPSSIPVYGDPPRPDPTDEVFGEFLQVKNTVQGLYDTGFLHTSPPPRTFMTLIPGDGQVTILWDNSPVFTPDPNYDEFVQFDPNYREYDFEGFRLWRSRTGMFSTAGDPEDPLNPVAEKENEADPNLDLTLLGQWDLDNGITMLSHGIQVLDYIIDQYGDTIVTEADTFDLGTDTGLRFSYIDSDDAGDPLINGFRYYYSIESYDYNSPELPVSSLSQSNGISFPGENSVIPIRRTDDLEVESELLHVDSDGNVVDDETPGEFVYENPPPATDALISSTVSVFNHEGVDDTYHTLVVDDIIADSYNQTSEVRFHMEDASGGRLYTGGESMSLFTMTYDSTLSSMLTTVFNPADTTVPLYELSMDFFANSEWYEVPPESTLTAVDSQGGDVTDLLGTVQIASGLFEPLGFRGTDLTMTWQEVSTDTMTLSVYDTGNRVQVPVVGEGEPHGLNWEFDSFGEQPGGAYLIGQPMVFRLYVSGVVIAVVSPTRFPEDGDVWTLRQRSFYVDDGDTIPASRPLVPGTRYRIEFSPAQDFTPPEFTIGIFQNTILTNDLDIHVVTSEEMDSIPELTVAGDTIPLSQAESEEVVLYSAAYRLDQSGTYEVEVRGFDTWGNEGEGSEDFSAGLITRSTGGIVLSADGVLRLDVPPDAVRGDSKFFLCQSNGEIGDGLIDGIINMSTAGTALVAVSPPAETRSLAGLRTRESPVPADVRKPTVSGAGRDVRIRAAPVLDQLPGSGAGLGSGNAIVKKGVKSSSNESDVNIKTGSGDVNFASDSGIAVSPVYILSPAGELLDRGAELSFDTSVLGPGGSDPEGLGIFFWTDEGWLELESMYNPTTNRVSSTVNMLGTYQLRTLGTTDTSWLPRIFRLAQNFPNPFNPSTVIGFYIPGENGAVRTELTVYDVRGRLVRILLAESKIPGSYYVNWDGRDDKGRKVASGIYLYRLRAGDFVSTRKMVLIK